MRQPRTDMEEEHESTEPIFQTVAIPLNAFEGIDPAEVTEVRFLFDRSPSGTILLDDIGFAGGLYGPAEAKRALPPS